jgi:DegV family protein with EDD domain
MIERSVKIITDAGADLPSKEILKSRFNIGPIEQIPLIVSFGEDEYIIGEDLDNNLFRDLVLKPNGIFPKTAALGPYYFSEAYEKLVKNGFDVLSIHLSENISSVCNNARLAAKDFGDRVSVCDSGAVSMTEGLMAIIAEEAAAAGKTKTEIINILDKIKDKIYLRAITPNIPYLENSGRVSHVVGMLGEKFKINPILQIDHGVVNKIATPIKMEGALNWMTKFTRREGKFERIVILDFEAKENAELLKNKFIEDKIPEEIISRGVLGPVTASHGGPGSIAVIFQK